MTSISSIDIAQAIERDSLQAMEYDRLYKVYARKSLPISNRAFADTKKINRKLINNFRGEIINQVVGYLFGHPLRYWLEQGEGMSDAKHTEASRVLQAWLRAVNSSDIDAETGKLAAICGTAWRLVHVTDEGHAGLELVPPWEIVEIDDAIIRHYYDRDENHIAVVYTNNTVATYDGGHSNAFVLTSEIPNVFGVIPLAEFPNNDERDGDFAGVESLIDAYDFALSDAQNELEEFRAAYMVFRGGDLPDNIRSGARELGAIVVPEDGDVSFLTKDINPNFIFEHQTILRENIYRFSGSVDMTDEAFSGSEQSGESRKWKLLALENKASIKARKFDSGLRSMFKILDAMWYALGVPIEADDIRWSYDRNIPIELTSEAQTTSTLKGLVSERTRLSLLSFVPDPHAELEAMEDDYLRYGGGLDDNNRGSTEYADDKVEVE